MSRSSSSASASASASASSSSNNIMRVSSVFPEYVLGHPPTNQQPPRSQVHRKKPKRRPPKEFLERVPVVGTLPQYSGPYGVGIIDLEIPAEGPRTFSNITRHKEHILCLETVLLSIYYPADRTPKRGTSFHLSRHQDRPHWLLSPRPLTSRGYGRFGYLPQWPTMAFFFATVWFTKIPASVNAPFADHWPPDNDSEDSGRTNKMKSGSRPAEKADRPVFPLLIFTHGMGGSRLAYSSLCGEFASHGFVVCALEHRDGSGARTLVNRWSGVGEREPHRLVDYVLPKADPHDTTPGHTVDKELRTAQIEMRLAEIEEAYRVMMEIHDGRGAEIAGKNVRFIGQLGGRSSLSDVDWSVWQDRFHSKYVTIVGHSFGGATAVEVLRQGPRFPYISQGIICDLWGIPVSAPQLESEHRIQHPVLCINSEAFMYWAENFEITKAVCDEALSDGQLAWLITVRGTVHISQSDFCILYPNLANTALKMTIDPVRCIDINIDASMEFLSRILPYSVEEQPFLRYLGKHAFLDVPPIEKLPNQHQPKEKWTAVRLRIRHEGRKRILVGSRKRYWKRLQKSKNEIWVHMCPETNEIERVVTSRREERAADHAAALADCL